MLTGNNVILTQVQKAENNGGDVIANDLNRNFVYNDTDATQQKEVAQ